MANDIGLSIKEGVANGATAFTEPSKRNIGLLMERERGPENTLFRITSLADDEARFGGLNANMYGPYIVRNMFKNAQGNALTYYGCRIVGAGSTAASATAALNDSEVTHIYTAGSGGSEDKGTWGNDLIVKFYSYNYLIKNAFAVQIYYKGSVVETFSATTMALLQAAINTNSTYIISEFDAEHAIPEWQDSFDTGNTITTTLNSKTVTAGSAVFNATDTPVGSLLRDNVSGTVLGTIAEITSTTVVQLERNTTLVLAAQEFDLYLRFKSDFTLAGGTYEVPAEDDFYAETVPDKKGLACFDGADVQYVGVTENCTITMAAELRDYCAEKSYMGLTILPLNATEAIIANYASLLQNNGKSYIAGMNCWVKTSDGDGGYAVVPALGCWIGAAIIRVPALQNDYIHIPPGGQDSNFVDIVDCYPQLLDQQTLNLYTRSYTVNSVVFRKGVGFFVITSRTYSTNELYQSIHIRVQTSFYVRVLEANMGFVLQKNQSPTLKRDIYTVLYAYFLTEYNNGALEQSVPFETACKIICDKSNNPTSQPRKDLNADVEWIPSEATEAVKITMKRNDGILLVTA